MHGFISGLFYSIGICFCFCANTILSWWLQLCSIIWSQDVWFLQLHFSFSNYLGVCSISVRQEPPRFCPTVSRDLWLVDSSVQLLSLALGPEVLVISQTDMNVFRSLGLDHILALKAWATLKKGKPRKIHNSTIENGSRKFSVLQDDGNNLA